MFEVIYSYHERLAEGGYDKDTKQLKKRIGETFEEVPLEKLATAVLGQLARRDIWVTDVEISEFKKQRVTFRETKGGIVLKNRKFALDGEAVGSVEEDEPRTAVALLPGTQPHQAAATGPRRPIKWVMLDDGVIQDAKGNRVPVPLAVKQAGLQLRSGQRYPVYQEAEDPRDNRVDEKGRPSLLRKKVYLVADDLRREVTVSQDWFVPADIELLADREVGFTQPKGGGGPRLMYDGEQPNERMPDLR